MTTKIVSFVLFLTALTAQAKSWIPDEYYYYKDMKLEEEMLQPVLNGMLAHLGEAIGKAIGQALAKVESERATPKAAPASYGSSSKSTSAPKESSSAVVGE